MGNTNVNGKLPTKVIFLDMDGVLNNAKSDITELFIVETELLLNLKRIVDETNAVIVLSSTWRYEQGTRDRVTAYLKSVNINPFISCTRNIGTNRVDEIICWLQDNTDFDENNLKDVILEKRTNRSNSLPDSMCVLEKRMNVSHWIAIDDMDLSKEGDHVAYMEDHFVHVSAKTGLTTKNADYAINLLFH